jgi:hypothetical protein
MRKMETESEGAVSIEPLMVSLASHRHVTSSSEKEKHEAFCSKHFRLVENLAKGRYAGDRFRWVKVLGNFSKGSGFLMLVTDVEVNREYLTQRPFF